MYELCKRKLTLFLGSLKMYLNKFISVKEKKSLTRWLKLADRNLRAPLTIHLLLTLVTTDIEQWILHEFCLMQHTRFQDGIPHRLSHLICCQYRWLSDSPDVCWRSWRDTVIGSRTGSPSELFPNEFSCLLHQTVSSWMNLTSLSIFATECLSAIGPIQWVCT